jgi:hypothetical protein
MREPEAAKALGIDGIVWRLMRTKPFGQWTTALHVRKADRAPVSNGGPARLVMHRPGSSLPAVQMVGAEPTLGQLESSTTELEKARRMQ